MSTPSLKHIVANVSQFVFVKLPLEMTGKRFHITCCLCGEKEPVNRHTLDKAGYLCKRCETYHY